jgi:hypothetical protein
MWKPGPRAPVSLQQKGAGCQGEHKKLKKKFYVGDEDRRNVSDTAAPDPEVGVDRSQLLQPAEVESPTW